MQSRAELLGLLRWGLFSPMFALRAEDGSSTTANTGMSKGVTELTQFMHWLHKSSRGDSCQRNSGTRDPRTTFHSYVLQCPNWLSIDAPMHCPVSVMTKSLLCLVLLVLSSITCMLEWYLENFQSIPHFSVLPLVNECQETENPDGCRFFWSPTPPLIDHARLSFNLCDALIDHWLIAAVMN